jgi:hypothetical protein
MEEQPLAGGMTVGAVRVGDTIRRVAQPWTPAAHAVLRYLESAGFEGSPRVLGFDDQGREVLSFVPGETVGDRRPWPAWVRSDAALIQVGRWLRRLHDVTAAFVPPEGLPWLTGQEWWPGAVIGHHDASPFNAVWQGERLVGFIDWDSAAPASREVDLAWALQTWVPLFRPHLAEVMGHTDYQDRPRRLHLLLDSYGHEGDRRAFAAIIPARCRRHAAFISRRAETGDPIFVGLRWLADALEESAKDVGALPASFWTPPATAP